MNKVFKKIGIAIGSLIAIFVVILLVITVIHRVSLGREQERIIPIGQMVEVNGHLMHIYIAGENTESMLLVFLSGSGTVAPVFDFRPLYSLLTGEFRIAVVEKFGYGYSDIIDVPRDIDSMLSDTRAALYAVGETGPFVLLPHSMSGLEALRWAQLYPSEVAGIIGIDIGIPSMYLAGYGTLSEFTMRFMQMTGWMGLHRFPPPGGIFIDSLLTEEEREQNRLLRNRNNMNRVFFDEGRNVVENANIIEQHGIPNIPILLLVAEGSTEQLGAFWIPHQEEFARQNGAKIDFFDAGHSIHHEKPERMADLIRTFISEQ